MPAINDTCPWSGAPVREDSFTSYRGAIVGFCNTGCRDKFATAVAAFDQALDKAGPTLFQMAGASPAPARLDNAVLVIIDAQDEYRSGALPLDGVDAAVAKLATLLVAARAAGTPVVHVVHRGKPNGIFDLAGKGAILSELAPLPGEAIVEKTLPNAFAGTGLLERLQVAGRPGLIVTGFMTHNCVSATARAALDLGYLATIAADATATRALSDPLGGPALTAAEVQRATLTELADRSAMITITVDILNRH